jgi:hypothetical protein
LYSIREREETLTIQPPTNSENLTEIVFREISPIYWNQANLSTLLDIQEATQEGCFFVGLYGLSAAIYPEKALPEAHQFLAEVKSQYGELLEKDRLMVRYDKIKEAIDIYSQWNLDLKKITVNNEGEKLIGKFLNNSIAPKKNTQKWATLKTDFLNPPYGILVHQAGGCNSHFITIDGTKKADIVAEKYFNDKYRIVTTFEFSKLCVEGVR